MRKELKGVDFNVLFAHFEILCLSQTIHFKQILMFIFVNQVTLTAVFPYLAFHFRLGLTHTTVNIAFLFIKEFEIIKRDILQAIIDSKLDGIY